jgi:hypothetical protein
MIKLIVFQYDAFNHIKKPHWNEMPLNHCEVILLKTQLAITTQPTVRREANCASLHHRGQRDTD